MMLARIEAASFDAKVDLPARDGPQRRKAVARNALNAA
jgi:hypothetical protein